LFPICDNRDGGPSNSGTQRTTGATPRDPAGPHNRVRSVPSLHTLLGDQLDEKTPDRDEVRLLARHLPVAVLGVASCHIGLGEDGQAVARIAAQLPLLRQASRCMFHETAGKDPARFLSLPVGGHVVSLAFLAELFQQANRPASSRPRDYPPADRFESHRTTIWPFAQRLPNTYQGAYVAGLQRELLAAVVAVEEVNRVCGIV